MPSLRIRTGAVQIPKPALCRMFRAVLNAFHAPALVVWVTSNMQGCLFHPRLFVSAVRDGVVF